jgi:intein/homing endonuclease
MLPKIDLLMGGSPCFTSDTLIMTNNGMKPIVDIKIGDYVLTHKSRYRKVLKTGFKEVNEVHILKGFGVHEIITTAEHPFYIRTKNSEPSWLSAKELEKGYYIGTTHNTEEINDIDNHNEDFWYFVGRFTADGWIVKTKRKHRKNSYMYRVVLCCGKHEFDIVKNIMDKLDFHYNWYEDKSAYKFYIYDMKLLSYLEKIGREAKNKRIHSDVWKLSSSKKKSFMEGYMSGDGCFTKGKFQATTVSKLLAYELKQLINEVYQNNCTLGYNIRPDKGKVGNRIVNQKSTYIIQFRKEINDKDRAFYHNNYSWQPFRKNTLLSEKHIVYNLEVEEDNSYTANTIVVHNCQGFSFAGKQLNFNDHN